jgi:hypothetical protein
VTSNRIASGMCCLSTTWRRSPYRVRARRLQIRRGAHEVARVYSRYAEHPEWRTFFADVTAARDAHLRAAGADSLEDFLRDYRYVRIGDLASLAFCNNWARVMAARRLRPGRKSMTAVAAPRCDDPVMRIRIYSLSTLVALTLAPPGSPRRLTSRRWARPMRASWDPLGTK